jgi:hypothetical protein
MPIKLFDLKQILMPQQETNTQFVSNWAWEVQNAQLPIIQHIEKIVIDDVYIPIGELVIRGKTYKGAIFGVEPADYSFYHRLAAIWVCDTKHDVILLGHNEIAQLTILTQAKPRATILKDILKRIVKLYVTDNFDRQALQDVLDFANQSILQPIFMTSIFMTKQIAAKN